MPWWDMGDHGFYVWTAYSLAAIFSLWLIAWPLYKQRRFLRQLKQQADSLEAVSEAEPWPRPPAADDAS